MQLHELKHKSTNILAIGFVGENRGVLHVQFHDGNGNPTSRGWYLDVPRAVYNALYSDRKPGAFLSTQIKNRFEWVLASAKPTIPGVDTSKLSPEELEELEYTIAHPDLTLPDVLVIPAGCNTLEAITECIDAQRVPIERKGLFE